MSCQEYELAFMSKPGWGLIHERDELWVQVLCSRYNCGSDLILHMNFSRMCSTTWKGIYAVQSEVERIMGWQVGNGQTTLFWRDRWVPRNQPLCDSVIHFIPPHLEGAIAGNLVKQWGEWNWHLFSSLLPNFT